MHLVPTCVSRDCRPSPGMGARRTEISRSTAPPAVPPATGSTADRGPTLSLDHVPGLSHVFLTDTLRTEPGRVGTNPAVHDGHHHGMDGALLALAAIALSRVVRSLAGWRQTALTALVSLTFVDGVANALEDFWLEQIVKRGASGYVFPKMLTPPPTEYTVPRDRTRRGGPLRRAPSDNAARPAGADALTHSVSLLDHGAPNRGGVSAHLMVASWRDLHPVVYRGRSGLTTRRCSST